MKNVAIITSAACLGILAFAGITLARNIDLSTIPDRASVQLTIYNSEDLTLVRETRKVSFKKGVNPLQFSWANTLIDPSSVELRFLTQPDKLTVLDTTFPHDKPQMLYWNVQSEFDGEATLEITYFTSGISWSADYVCIADADETKMGFEGFVRVSNRSGEEYEDAQVRLIVGKINLVEKIAQLARLPISQLREEMVMDSADFSKMRHIAVAGSIAKAERMDSRNGKPAAPKQIIKEGLSEYFMYTIEGTETIPNGWSKRMRSFEGKTIPFKIQYRYRPREYGNRLVRMYLMTNDEESKLGTTPLPDGQVRVFRRNGRDGLSFLAHQHIQYIPIGDKIELNLGVDPDVVFELIQKRAFRDEIWMHIHGTSVYQRVEDGRLRIEVNSSVAGWDENAIYMQRIRNYTPKPIEVEVRRSYGGHVYFKSLLPRIKLHDYRTVQYTTTLEPGEKKDLFYEVTSRQGYRKKQDNVTLVEEEIKP